VSISVPLQSMFSRRDHSWACSSVYAELNDTKLNSRSM